MLHNFSAGRFALLYPRYAGRAPAGVHAGQRREIKQIAKSAIASGRSVVIKTHYLARHVRAAAPWTR